MYIYPKQKLLSYQQWLLYRQLIICIKYTKYLSFQLRLLAETTNGLCICLQLFGLLCNCQVFFDKIINLDIFGVNYIVYVQYNIYILIDSDVLEPNYISQIYYASSYEPVHMSAVQLSHIYSNCTYECLYEPKLYEPNYTKVQLIQKRLK